MCTCLSSHIEDWGFLWSAGQSVAKRLDGSQWKSLPGYEGRAGSIERAAFNEYKHGGLLWAEEAGGQARNQETRAVIRRAAQQEVLTWAGADVLACACAQSGSPVVQFLEPWK